jgi:hypothetical protein|tara:strand:- start:17010 stop:18377 length:1368 start_codon:yes stop_codon:yes gene_type:complete
VRLLKHHSESVRMAAAKVLAHSDLRPYFYHGLFQMIRDEKTPLAERKKVMEELTRSSRRNQGFYQYVQLLSTIAMNEKAALDMRKAALTHLGGLVRANTAEVLTRHYTDPIYKFYLSYVITDPASEKYGEFDRLRAGELADSLLQLHQELVEHHAYIREKDEAMRKNKCMLDLKVERREQIALLHDKQQPAGVRFKALLMVGGSSGDHYPSEVERFLLDAENHVPLRKRAQYILNRFINGEHAAQNGTDLRRFARALKAVSEQDSDLRVCRSAKNLLDSLRVRNPGLLFDPEYPHGWGRVGVKIDKENQMFHAPWGEHVDSLRCRVRAVREGNSLTFFAIIKNTNASDKLLSNGQPDSLKSDYYELSLWMHSEDTVVRIGGAEGQGDIKVPAGEEILCHFPMPDSVMRMPKDDALQFSCRLVAEGSTKPSRDPKVASVWHGDIRSDRLQIGGEVE